MVQEPSRGWAVAVSQPGSFQTALLDALRRISPDDLARHVAIEAV